MPSHILSCNLLWHSLIFALSFWFMLIPVMFMLYAFVLINYLNHYMYITLNAPFVLCVRKKQSKAMIILVISHLRLLLSTIQLSWTRPRTPLYNSNIGNASPLHQVNDAQMHYHYTSPSRLCITCALSIIVI